MSRLGNSVVVVTGGARGIGLAVARAAVRRGAKVAVADIDASAADEAAADLGPGCRGYGLDVSDASAFEAMIETVENDLGQVTVLVNNAGIAEASPTVGEQSRVLVDRMIDVNLGGVINGTLAALEWMEPRRRGQIVNVASQAGRLSVPALAAYTASKYGVVGFTDAVRFEYRDSGVCFTCVMPGPVDTGMMQGTKRVPLIRLVSPETVAEEVIAAIEKRREDVFVPRSSGYLVRFAGVLPPKARERLSRLFGLHRLYAEIDPSKRNDYSDRIARQTPDH